MQPPPRPNQKHSYHGFNLVEAAIVLGIVGLVIGGIWIAAAQMKENALVNNLAQGVLQISTGIEHLVPRANADALGNATITTQMISAGVFPSDWISNGVTLTPANGTVVITSVPNASPPARFQIALSNLSQSVCIRLAIAVSSKFVSTGWYDNQGGGLMHLYFTPSGVGTSVFPYQAGASACTSATANTIRFAFAYKTF